MWPQNGFHSGECMCHGAGRESSEASCDHSIHSLEHIVALPQHCLGTDSQRALHKPAPSTLVQVAPKANSRSIFIVYIDPAGTDLEKSPQLCTNPSGISIRQHEADSQSCARRYSLAS
jgi:hypothetical protein